MSSQFTIRALVVAAATAGCALAAQAGPFPSKTNSGDAAKEPTPTLNQFAQAQARVPTRVPTGALRNPKVSVTALPGPISFQMAGHQGGKSAAHLNRQWQQALPPALSSTLPPRSTQAVGWQGLPFTSARVEPAVDMSYPTRTVGRLSFTDGSAWYSCTASVLRPGVVLTAGHCVHSGSATMEGFFSGFTFAPGYRHTGKQVTAPYGVWTNWRTVYTSNTWYQGGGTVPNAADWAVIVFDRDGLDNPVGAYTGWLGWSTGKAVERLATVLGYPYNLGDTRQLNRVDTVTIDLASLSGEQVNNIIWGSDMMGGSSGGPIVKNWGRAYPDTSGDRPRDSSRNNVISVVSWGFEETAFNVQGGAIFNADFAGLMQQVCTENPDAC